MKKIFTLLSIVTLSSIMFAQSLTSINENSALSQKISKLSKVQDIIYLQDVLGSQGIVSNVLANGRFVAAADDFTLTQKSKLTKASIIGFQNNGTLESSISKGLILYIYEDVDGKPAGIPGNSVEPLVKIDISNTDESYHLLDLGSGYFIYEVDFTKILESDLILSKDKPYWLVFAAKTNLTNYSSGDRFNWSGGETGGSKSKLVDPSDAFGVGATNWTDIYDLVGTNELDGLSFMLEGETTLGTGEIYSSEKKISVYPNPITDVINVKTTGSIKTKSIQVVDLSGNIVSSNADKDSINVSSLPKGVYFVKVEDNLGKVFIQKVVKK